MKELAVVHRTRRTAQKPDSDDPGVDLRRPRRVPKQDAEELAGNIGRRTAELRLEHELTQQDLATRLRATVQWISRIENGKENLTLGTLVKLANVLEVAVIDLFAAPKSNPRRPRRGRPKKANAD